MLDLAIKHKDKVLEKFANTMYEEKYKFYNFASYYDPIEINTTVGWGVMQCVSIDKSGEIIGFMSASISQDDKIYTGLSIINFTDNKITFGRDLNSFIEKLMSREDISKLTYSVAVGNPIESTYDKLTEKYGGRIVGTFTKHIRLFDGKMYDKKMYEIMREDYIKAKIK